MQSFLLGALTYAGIHSGVLYPIIESVVPQGILASFFLLLTVFKILFKMAYLKLKYTFDECKRKYNDSLKQQQDENLPQHEEDTEDLKGKTISPKEDQVPAKGVTMRKLRVVSELKEK
jgi:hypothetical protein